MCNLTLQYPSLAYLLSFLFLFKEKKKKGKKGKKEKKRKKDEQQHQQQQPRAHNQRARASNRPSDSAIARADSGIACGSVPSVSAGAGGSSGEGEGADAVHLAPVRCAGAFYAREHVCVPLAVLGGDRGTASTAAGGGPRAPVPRRRRGLLRRTHGKALAGLRCRRPALGDRRTQHRCHGDPDRCRRWLHRGLRRLPDLARRVVIIVIIVIAVPEPAGGERKVVLDGHLGYDGALRRLHDVCPRVDRRQPELGHVKLGLQVALPLLLQHPLGLVPRLDPLGGLR